MMPLNDHIAHNHQLVLERIDRAAQRSGRSAAEITLVAVTKTHPATTIADAYRAGLRHFGENRVNELESKWEEVRQLLGPHHGAQWHAIGPLQSRQTNVVADFADHFHALDRWKIARRLSQRMEQNGRSAVQPLPVFLEVNLSGESSKAGFNCSQWERDESQQDLLREAATNIAALPGLLPEGLMTMAPWGASESQLRDVFRRARQLAKWLQEMVPQVAWSSLSMGMTDDFEIAIEEGATHVRIGRALFGARQQAG